MERKIRKVAILGSGTMGSGLAAHLANAGIPSYMLDIVPKELTVEEKAKGLTLDNPQVRNRIVEQNKQNGVVKMKPASIMSKDFARRITTGNFEDNLEWLSECDWIIEVVAEKLDIKKQVLKKIEPYIKPGTIVTTNTSGISINRIAEDMSPAFRKNWLGTHFFNPVRYMNLVELIPGKETDSLIFDFMHKFCEKVLGKTVVVCKDTPCFIANRIGSGLGTDVLNLTVKYDLSISTVDALTGTCLGRPRTATYRLFDMVGLDIGTTSPKTVSNNIDDPAEKKLFEYPAFVDQMMKDGRMGDKAGQGFYKKDGKQRLMFDYKTGTYVQPAEDSFESLAAANTQKDLPSKLQALYEGDDVAARFVWEHMKTYFLHAASLIPEISDDILSIDRAMVLGYNHKAGPFQIWNGLDLSRYVTRMESEGAAVPVWVKEMLAGGFTAFYTEKGGRDYYYSIPDKAYMPIGTPADIIVLKDLKADGKVVVQWPEAALLDIGDGVVCFEIQSKNSALSTGLNEALVEAYDELDKNWAGMVITSGGKNFCVGADLKGVTELIRTGDFSVIDESVKVTQSITLCNKYSTKPIVSAPFGMALGGGCELSIQCAATQAAGETYMGLVEFGVGLVPAGGGMKEITMRTLERTEGTMALKTEFLLAAIQTVAMAKTSSSGFEAIELGLMRKTDGVSLSRGYQIVDAKQKVLSLLAAGYTPPIQKPFPCPGLNDNALLLMSAKTMVDAGYMSDYDYYIYEQLVFIMTGGGVSKNQMITEQYLLDLEREVFVRLCKEKKTQERITHMLTTGKPLRN